MTRRLIRFHTIWHDTFLLKYPMKTHRMGYNSFLDLCIMWGQIERRINRICRRPFHYWKSTRDKTWQHNSPILTSKPRTGFRLTRYHVTENVVCSTILVCSKFKPCFYGLNICIKPISMNQKVFLWVLVWWYTLYDMDQSRLQCRAKHDRKSCSDASSFLSVCEDLSSALISNYFFIFLNYFLIFVLEKVKTEVLKKCWLTFYPIVVDTMFVKFPNKSAIFDTSSFAYLLGTLFKLRF